MKLFSVLFVAAAICLFASCNKDTCTQKRELYKYTPVYQNMASLRTVNVKPAKTITSNGKIFTVGNYIYLNEVNKGFHVINNTNPSNPQTVSFIEIPGNLDLVGYGNYLMADNYRDLLTFNISNPATPQLVARKENALPYRIYNYGFKDDSIRGICVDFVKEKATETVDCNETRFWWGSGDVFLSTQNVSFAQVAGGKAIGGATGQTGSLSRFAINNNHLYVANRFSVTPIDITNPLVPAIKAEVFTGEVETLYPFRNHLLMGSPNGMWIYSLTNPDVPTYLSGFSHWRGCDPVVAKGSTAFVTVRGGSPCGGDINELDVLDVSDMSRPVIVKRYPMQNPYGLGIIDNTLGVCDGSAGFKLYDANNVTTLVQKATLNQTTFFDVIMLQNNTAMLIGADGLYQYNISNVNAPQYLSKIAIVK